MLVEFGLSNLAPEWAECVVCLGTFDGVHLGHQEVISTAVATATRLGLPVCLITFDRHPAAILRPSSKPPTILGLERRLEKFAELGVSVAVVLPFDRELSEIQASEFLDQILVGRLKARELVVGHDFAMGKSRIGSAEWLKARIPTEIIPQFEIHGRRVSSSLVRQAIEEGDLSEAQLLLGEPFQVSGIVIRGDRLGRTLGYPTANVARAISQVLPPDGVYAGQLSFTGGVYSAAVSIGTRPSINGTDRRFEAYCLDYSGPEFYGKNVIVQLFRFIRGQTKFESLDALKEQIAKDVSQVRNSEMNGLVSASITP